MGARDTSPAWLQEVIDLSQLLSLLVLVWDPPSRPYPSSSKLYSSSSGLHPFQQAPPLSQQAPPLCRFQPLNRPHSSQKAPPLLANPTPSLQAPSPISSLYLPPCQQALLLSQLLMAPPLPDWAPCCSGSTLSTPPPHHPRPTDATYLSSWQGHFYPLGGSLLWVQETSCYGPSGGEVEVRGQAALHWTKHISLICPHAPSGNTARKAAYEKLPWAHLSSSPQKPHTCP